MVFRKMMFDTPAVQQNLESSHADLPLQEDFEPANNVRKIVFLFHRKMNLISTCLRFASVLPPFQFRWVAV